MSQSNTHDVVYETRTRSISKCITWRTIAFVDTVILSLIFTGSIGRALAIGGIEICTKTVLYYAHERVWLFLVKRVDSRRLTEQPRFSGSKLHSVSKTISWRVVGTLDTFFIALVITGDLFASSAIGITEVFTKIALYYVHERGWVRVSWGKSDTANRSPGMQRVRAFMGL